MILVGLVTTDEEDVIASRQAENKLLREQLGTALDGKLVRPAVANDNVSPNGLIECRERLGGLLTFYSRSAA